MIATWPCPTADGPVHKELAITWDRGRAVRLLILPALFDEANKMRQFTNDVMRRLDQAGVDCMLPDLPGCNESLQALEQQDLASWQTAAKAAATHFRATHVLTIRSSIILSPQGLAGWSYAPSATASAIRTMLRAAQIQAREAGQDTALPQLQDRGRTQGIELAGYPISPRLFRDLEGSNIKASPDLIAIPQEALGDGGLWLRAEPDTAPHQAEILSQIILKDLKL